MCRCHIPLETRDVLWNGYSTGQNALTADVSHSHTINTLTALHSTRGAGNSVEQRTTTHCSDDFPGVFNRVRKTRAALAVAAKRRSCGSWRGYEALGLTRTDSRLDSTLAVYVRRAELSPGSAHRRTTVPVRVEPNTAEPSPAESDRPSRRRPAEARSRAAPHYAAPRHPRATKRSHGKMGSTLTSRAPRCRAKPSRPSHAGCLHHAGELRERERYGAVRFAFYPPLLSPITFPSISPS